MFDDEYRVKAGDRVSVAVMAALRGGSPDGMGGRAAKQAAALARGDFIERDGVLVKPKAKPAKAKKTKTAPPEKTETDDDKDRDDDDPDDDDDEPQPDDEAKREHTLRSPSGEALMTFEVPDFQPSARSPRTDRDEARASIARRLGIPHNEAERIPDGMLLAVHADALASTKGPRR